MRTKAAPLGFPVPVAVAVASCSDQLSPSRLWNRPHFDCLRPPPAEPGEEGSRRHWLSSVAAGTLTVVVAAAAAVGLLPPVDSLLEPAAAVRGYFRH